MRLSHVLLLTVALALTAAPVAAQGKAIGKPAGKPASAGKPTGAGKPTTRPAKAQTTTGGEQNGRGKLTAAERLALNPQQKTRIEAALVGTGLTLDEAADGFKNQGRFIAAINASQNQPNVSFVDLKAKMTGPDQLSLGEALQQVKAEAPAPASLPADTTTTPTP